MGCETRCSAATRSCTRGTELSRTASLLQLDAGRLDDRPPFLDFSLLVSGKRFGRLLVARENLHPEFAQPCAYRWVGQSTHDSRIKLRCDILRRALRCPQAEPEGNVKSR